MVDSIITDKIKLKTKKLS